MKVQLELYKYLRTNKIEFFRDFILKIYSGKIINFKLLYSSAYSKVILIIFIMSIASACDFFSTRNPQQPDIGKSPYIPPTEPSIVLVNLETALRDKNIDNYMNCFYNFGDKIRLEFQFFAATDALTQFPSVFNNWSANEERRSFNSIISSVAEGQSPKLEWVNRKPFQETADSAIFTSDYIVHIPNNDKNIPETYSGRLQFTMSFRDNGLWYISRWVDINAHFIDSIPNTWSVLKGFYYN